MDNTESKNLKDLLSSNLSLPSSAGGTFEIPEGFKGKWSIIYFYPKDDTPGCTKQACGYRDNAKSFSDSGIQVYGISADDLDSHAAFISKFQLNFTLLSDSKKELAKALGVGTFPWISRDSFLIDPQGVVKKVWRKVDPKTTINETLEAAKSFL